MIDSADGEPKSNAEDLNIPDDEKELLSTEMLLQDLGEPGAQGEDAQVSDSAGQPSFEHAGQGEPGIYSESYGSEAQPGEGQQPYGAGAQTDADQWQYSAEYQPNSQPGAGQWQYGSDAQQPYGAEPQQQYGAGQPNSQPGSGQWQYGPEAQQPYAPADFDQNPYGPGPQPPFSTEEMGAFEDGTSPRRKRKIPQWSKYLIVVVITALLFFNVGIIANDSGWVNAFSFGQSGSDGTATDVANRLDEVANKLDSNGLYSYDVDTATEKAITSLLESSDDKYAEYYDTEGYKQFLNNVNGDYLGIGIYMSKYGNYVVVTGVVEGSPAEKAGVQTGDVVVSIDGEEKEWTCSEVIDALKRGEGETVDIVWLRPTEDSLNKLIEAANNDIENASDDSSGSSTNYSADDNASTTGTASKIVLEGKEISTTLTYEEVKIPAVSYEMMGDIGYIQITTFSSETATDTKDAVEMLQSEGAKGLVIDLRDNGGGYVEQAIEIVSMFVEDGDVLQIRSKDSTQTISTTGDKICDLPLVVLVNGNTASASEITTAALKDNDRATVVGTTTYGKGLIQQVAPLSFGGAIKYTIAEYLSPNGDTIDGVGITPDVVVEAESITTDDSDDVQLNKAIEVLQDKIGE
ncbi:MAG: S41 family peptidase [Coriobacteriales bacterium]|jgi:carboxyl-terminal processing protease